MRGLGPAPPLANHVGPVRGQFVWIMERTCADGRWRLPYEHPARGKKQSTPLFRACVGGPSPAQPSPSQPKTAPNRDRNCQARACSWNSLGQESAFHRPGDSPVQSPPLDILSPHSLLSALCSALRCSALPVSLRSDTRLDVCTSPSYHIRSGRVVLPTASLILIFLLAPGA